MSQQNILDITWGTIFKIAVGFLFFYLIYLIKDILIWFIFALIISVLLKPAIDFLQNKRIPLFLSVVFVYIGVFGIFALLIYLIAPIFISEIQQFSQLFPSYFEKLAPPLSALGIEAFKSFETFISVLQNWLLKISSSIFSGIWLIFGGIFTSVSIFILAIFLSLEANVVEKVIRLVSPKNLEEFFLDIWQRSQKKVVGWFGVRILCSLIVGVLTFITAYLLNIKYAVLFGFLAGVFDIVPIFGPIIAGLIIFVFTLVDSWSKAIFFLIAFILIQQIEANILTPILSKKFIGLPPVLILVVLMIGGALGGILGAILAIPLAGILFEFLKEILERRKSETANREESQI